MSLYDWEDVLEDVWLDLTDVQMVPGDPSNSEEYWRRCHDCDITFCAERAYKRHMRSARAHTSTRPFRCSLCDKMFARRDVRDRHEERSCRPKRRLDETDFAGVDEDPRRRRYNAIEESSTPDVVDVEARDVQGFDVIDEACFSMADAGRDTTLTCNEVIYPSAEASADFSDFVFDFAGTTGGSPLSTPELGHEDDSGSSGFSIPTSLRTIREAQSRSPSPATSEESRLPHPDLNSKPALKKFGTICTVCQVPFESDDQLLMEHLQKHLPTEEPKNRCEICDLDFEHESDMDHHLSSAKDGDCGFHFDHAIPCTGHHPPDPTGALSATVANDRCKLQRTLRAWELSQLQLQISSIHRLQILKAGAAVLSRSSLLAVRSSIASFVSSLNSFRSEPVIAEDDMASIEEDLGQLSIGRPLRQIRKKWKLKGMTAASAALSLAAFRGDLGAVLNCLSRGADIDTYSANTLQNAVAKVISGFTPLMLATVAGHEDVVSSLIEHGASVDVTASTGETAVVLAVNHGHSKIVEMVLEASKRSNVFDISTEAALVESVLSNHADITRSLLANYHSELPSFNESLGPLLLHYAVEGDLVDTVQALLDHGADANSISCPSAMIRGVPQSRGSVLFIKPWQRAKSPEMAQALLRAGASFPESYNENHVRVPDVPDPKTISELGYWK